MYCIVKLSNKYLLQLDFNDLDIKIRVSRMLDAYKPEEMTKV